MRTYFIKTYRIEESEKVIKTLSKYVVEDVRRERSVMCYESIRFECKKSEWKKIKKELNLKVTIVFAKMKIE